jgi:hypothetical protein
VRRALIRTVLPFALCLVPPLAGVVVAAAIPRDAMHDYLARIRHSPIDWLILTLGTVLFTAQMILGWRALRWQTRGFDERPDRWLSSLAQAAEWFPLLGLLGTVAAILQTFSSIPAGGTITPGEVIRRYAPAITATGSGLFMALLNILPTWVVSTGRDLILALAESAPPGEST